MGGPADLGWACSCPGHQLVGVLDVWSRMTLARVTQPLLRVSSTLQQAPGCVVFLQHGRGGSVSTFFRPLLASCLLSSRSHGPAQSQVGGTMAWRGRSPAHEAGADSATHFKCHVFQEYCPKQKLFPL